MRLYTYLLKLQLLNAMAYRFEYLSSIGRNLFFLLGSVFLWRTAYRGIDQVAGVTEAQMGTYAVVAVLMNACFTVSIDNELFAKIRAGEIALDLIRPMNLVWYWMTEDVGRSLAAVTQFALPLLAISVLLVIVGGTLIYWSYLTLISSIAFWTMRSQPLADASLELMARGTFYPLTVYPWPLQALLTFVLPLGFIGFYPACDFLGQSANTSLPLDVALWTPAVGVAMLVLALAVFAAGLRRYESAGS